MKPVAISGAGITWLTAAYWLQQRGVPVTTHEASSPGGGVIRSYREDGYLAEAGPSSILETSPRISALIQDLGPTARRVHALPTAANR
ncbi:MAG: FAD-dependent oxidoreductase [Deltaproteobacteria bacterium]